LFLMALNNNGTAKNILTTGYVAAVCIVNATDSDDTVKLRSYAMRNIINQNTAFPTVPIASFHDRLIWWSAKRGNDYYMSPSGHGFEPKAIGRATFILDNNDNELDPRNTASSLYGYLEPGKLIRLQDRTLVGLDITPYIFAGVSDDIVVDRLNKRVTLQCVDMWGWLNQKHPNVALLENTTASTAIFAIRNDVSYPNVFGASVFDGGINNIPYWWTTGKTAKEEIEDLANADMGFVFIRSDGGIQFKNRRTFDFGGAATMTEPAFEKDIKLTAPWENRRNIIDIRQEVDATTIWEYAEQKRLAPGEEFEIWASFRYDGNFVPATEVQAPTIVFNTRESGLGADILSDLTVTTTTYADKMKMVVKNDGAVTGWIISASITGKPIDTKGTSRIEHKMRKPLYIDNDWLQDYNVANGFAQFLGDYLTRGDPYITVKLRGVTAGYFESYELYKLLAVNFSTLGITANYRIMSIEYTCGQSVNDVTATYKLQPAYNEPGTTFFTLGTSELGGSDILAW